MVGLDLTSRTTWRGVSLLNSGHLGNVRESINPFFEKGIAVPGRRLSITCRAKVAKAKVAAVEEDILQETKRSRMRHSLTKHITQCS